MEYAVLPHHGDWRAAQLYDAADEFLVPVERTHGGGLPDASRPPSGRTLRVDGRDVSSVVRDPGGLVVRVFNASPLPSTARVEHEGAPARGWIVDLLGGPLEPFAGEVALGAWEIATLQLD